MADHNDDLLDDEGLDPTFEVDLADEEALLADDFDDGTQSTLQEPKRKVFERSAEDEDFIDIGIEEDIVEDVRHDNSENGTNKAFDEQNDSGDEVRERSRFKTERNITLAPARSDKPIPETLDAVPVKTVGQSIRSRLGPQPPLNRRTLGGRGGSQGHFRGRGRGGGFFHHPNNFQNQPNFNHYQGGGGYHQPPSQPHQYGGPPTFPMDGPPPSHQIYGPSHGPLPHHVEPPSMVQEQQMAPHHFQPGPPPVQSYQQLSQQVPLPHPQVHQQPPPTTQPYYENSMPPPKSNQPPSRIHVNPHFKNNLGNIWNGISNSWASHQSSTPQQTADQFPPPQNEWAENAGQGYYNQPSSHQYSEYPDNQYYNPGQDHYYQQNNTPPQQYQQPLNPPPARQENWDGNTQSNYYPPPVLPENNQFYGSPDQHIVGNPPISGPLPYGPQQGPPTQGQGPPHGPPFPGGLRGPPPFMGPRGPPGPRGPIRGQHLTRGRPPLMGPPPKIMRTPFQGNNVHHSADNFHSGMNVSRANLNHNNRIGSNLNIISRVRHQNPTPVRTTMVVNKQLQRKETVSNIVPIKTLNSLPPEDEDEETKAYRKKIEEQKKLREDLLRQKEERRKVAIKQKLQQQEDGVINTALPSSNVANQDENLETTYKTVRIMQSDGTTVLRKLTLAQIAKLKKITPASATPKPPAKTEELGSKLVSIENLSASTSYRLLMDMARTVGVVETVNLDSDARKAFIRFMKPEDAQTFALRHHRKMVDLSMIQATVVPESTQLSKRG